MRPFEYKIYKGISGKHGAIQFSILPPCYECSKCGKKSSIWKHPEVDRPCNGKMREKEGAVFIKATSAIGPNQYDWDSQISFALGIPDIGQILNAVALHAKVTIFHRPMREGSNQISKKLQLNPAKDDGGYYFEINQAKGKSITRTHKVPISSEEMRILTILLTAAVPMILKWA